MGLDAEPIAALGFVVVMDPDRVGAFGHSGGGFATVRAMLDFPEVYKAGVALSGPHDARYFNPGFVEAYDGADDPEAWARASNVDIADRLAGRLLLIVPEAEHTYIDCLAYVRKRCWDFLVRELMGTQPPAYRPAPIAIDPALLGELFA